MFAYALLLSAVAATVYEQPGPTVSTPKTDDAEAQQLATSKFSYENTRTDNETTVTTMNTAKAESDSLFGTTVLTVNMVSCIKVDDTGRSCTTDDSGVDTCTGKNKYDCSSISTTYTDAT